MRFYPTAWRARGVWRGHRAWGGSEGRLKRTVGQGVLRPHHWKRRGIISAARLQKDMFLRHEGPEGLLENHKHLKDI